MTTRRVRTLIRTAATCFGLILAATSCAVTDSGSGGTGTSATSSLAPAAPESAGEAPLALAMAQEISWKQWHGTRLPVTGQWGPAHVNGNAATGFSHTSEGAVLAMMQHQLRLAGLDDKDWQAAAQQMAVVAPAEQPPTTRVATGFDTTGTLPFVAGFEWIPTATPDRAEADLALQTASGDLSTVRATEVWRDGDWKAELPAGGSRTRPLSGLSDYQPWPGTPR